MEFTGRQMINSPQPSSYQNFQYISTVKNTNQHFNFHLANQAINPRQFVQATEKKNSTNILHQYNSPQNSTGMKGQDPLF